MSPIEHIRLENGLELLVQTTTHAPLVAIYVWVDAGTWDEPEGAHGAAHFLEHMLFKGSATRGVGVATAEIEGMGGDLNAYTTHDQTVVHATVQSECFEAALDVVVDLVRGPVFDPVEFGREKQVVLEEIRSYEDDPETVVEDAAAALLYPGHAYGRPILGTTETVGGISREMLMDFWHDHYGPNRCIVSIAGDIDLATAKAAVTRITKDWQSSRQPRAEPDEPAEVAGPITKVLRREFESRTTELGWRTPAVGHDDVAALDVLTTALGVGAASVLTAAVQRDGEAATEPWAALSTRRCGGALSIGLLPREKKSPDAVALALEEVRRVAQRGLPGAVIARARDAILTDALFSEETVDGLAHEAAWSLARTGDPAGHRAHQRAVAAVSSTDVQRVAATWLRPDSLVLTALDTDLRKPGEQRLRAEAARRPSPARGTGEPVRHVLDNGATILVLPDKSPVMAARLVGLGGSLVQQSRTAGLGSAWSRMIASGAGGLDAESLAEELDALAGTVDGIVGRNSIGLSATFPAAHTVDGLELLGTMTLEPAFDADEWERVRAELIEEVHTVSDRPGTVANQAVWSALWPGHPWRLPRFGTESSLNRITPATLRRWHTAQLTASNLVLAVAGGVDPDEVIEVCSQWLTELPTGSGGPTVLEAQGPSQGGLRKRRAGREQTQVVLACRGARLADTDRSALEVGAAVLGGQSGRLFMHLREARGLAYSVWAHSTEGLPGGIFRVSLATDPARAREARGALRDELSRAIDEPPTEDEVQRYKRMLLGHALMGLQRASGRAADAAIGERFNLPWGLAGHREQLEAVDATAVRSALESVLARPRIEVVVEPLT